MKELEKRRPEVTWLRQFLGFAGVGVVGTAGHYAILIALVQLAGVKPLFGSIAGFVVGAIVNYFLSYLFIFGSRKRHSEALTKFLAVATVGAGINALVVWFGIEVIMWHYLVAQLAATTIVLTWNFTINKLWTFSLRREGAG